MKLAAFLAAGALIGATALPAYASQGEASKTLGSPSSNSQRELALTPEERQDTLTLAAQTGVSAESLLQKAAGQNEFSVLVESIRSSYPDNFVDAAWSPDGKSDGYITLTVGAHPAAVDSIAENKSVRMEFSAAPTETQRLAATEVAYKTFVAESGIAEVVASSDPATGAVELAYAGASPRIELGRIVETARSKASAAAGRSVDLKLTRSAAASIAAPEYSGGMYYSGSAGGCTGAFTVQSGSTYGISTAAHCGSVGSYDGASFVTQTIIAANTGDARWSRSTSGAPSSAFQYTSGGFRYADSGNNPAVGTTVCKFGYATGYTCSTVYKTGICANSYCGLYSAAAYISNSGDSGGPWFYGSGAKGIHHGRATIDGQTRSLFTRIGIVNLMNAIVYTG